MKSEEEGERVNMTAEELPHWVQEQVQKNEQLVQRQAQLAQVEGWVKKKEKEAARFQLLYDNTYESALECESVIKDLYGMLGLEYRDTDSEEEGGGARPMENIMQTKKDKDSGENDELSAEVVGGDDYVVFDLGASVPETAVKEEPKEVEVSAGIESSEFLPQYVKKPEVDGIPTKDKLPSPVPNRPPDNLIPIIKTCESCVRISTSSPCDSPGGSPPGSSGTSTLINETVENSPMTTIPNTSSTSVENTDRTEPSGETSASTKQNDEAPEQIVPSTPASKSSKNDTVNQKSASKSKSSNATLTSGTAGKTSAKERVTRASPKPSSKPSNATPPSNSTVIPAPAEKAKNTDPKQGNKPEMKSPISSPRSGTTDSKAADKTSRKTSTKPPDAPEVSQTTVTPAIPATTTTPGMAPSTPEVPFHVQKEVMLKVNMNILGRRRTKTWHPGTILDIKTTDSVCRYKVLFDGGKGKSVLSAHHLACIQPPMLKDLFVGCRVVANYKEGSQSWLHAAIVAEMPDRKNRMRFLVFFDDGRPAYISLPDLHLVCKPLSTMTEDIEDEAWREELEEYLQAYPNPIFVVMRVGQDSKVERDGKMEHCTVTQVDGSLIEICYKNEEKEWLYKGSNRLDQIRKIKKRVAEQRKEQAVNKAGWIVPQKNNKPTNTTITCTTAATSTTISTTTAATSTTISTSTTTTAATTRSTTPTTTTASASSSTALTIKTEPVKTSTAPTVSQKSSSVTMSSSTVKIFDGKPILQPRVILTRITLPLRTDTAEHPVHIEPVATGSSSTEIKCPPSEEEDNRSLSAVVPVVEPRLKYVPHRCCPACLNHVRPTQKDQHRGQNPLLIPLLHGFRRMTARRRVDGKMSFHVFYRAPCGRSLCDMKEVQAFLFESRCDFLFLEMFCLDPFVLVQRALLPSSMASRPYLSLPDISEGKELVPVPCVNELNTVSLPPMTYTRHRHPAPGVFINTNLDFMVGCDCTDGCRDRSKCSCHQLTIEATSLFHSGPVDVTAGYTHKRLPRYIPTGVYECNALCRCDPWLCGNRLVQHGLQLRLEVFMTQHKGWGLRCLDDMSKGTFVCVFTGKVVKDELVSTENETTGNEYLANLDYIEGVEKLKHGYESEAYCSDPEEHSDKKNLVTMTTGAPKMHGLFQIDLSSSSGEEKEESTQEKTETRRTPSKRQRRVSDSEEDDDLDDEDYKINLDDDSGAEWKYLSHDFNRSYSTRRNIKIPEKNEGHNSVQNSPKITGQQNEVSPSMAKKMRIEGPGRHKMGFAKKSTSRSFAIKSSHRRVKPERAPEKHKQDQEHSKKCTRSMFNGEKSCYLIDAKQEGNLARFINHSCSPNLFVQNVFVDTHDLRFPWVAFFTSKRIRAGTELTWDYSYEVGSVEGKVLLCCCGSSECTGRLL